MSDVWDFPASTLVRVVDGDTFIAEVSRSMDFGFHVIIPARAWIKFRLDGCNAAPISTPSGAGAADRTRALLTGQIFDLRSLGPYKYGDEWMARVTFSDGRDLTSALVAEQWAAPWDGNGAQPLPPWPRTV